MCPDAEQSADKDEYDHEEFLAKQHKKQTNNPLRENNSGYVQVYQPSREPLQPKF